MPKNVQEELDQVDIPGQDIEYCIEILERVSKTYPNFIPAKLNLGAILLNSSNIEKARNVYEEVLRTHDGDNRAIAGLSTVLSAEEKHDKAEEYARKAISNGYKWQPCYEVIAKALEAKGDISASIEYYLKAYELHPHSWENMESYCRLNERTFFSPMDNNATKCITDKQLEDLCDYIEKAAIKKDEEGNILGCDHTFRFTKEWAINNKIDKISLYQYLNSHGGFCDCEVCYNVESSVLDLDDEE